MKRIILAICLIILCTYAEAADYYIDADGTGCSSPSDAQYDPTATPPSCGGGSSKVWTTIQGCINGETLVAGDVVYIRAGTYAENLNITNADEGAGGTYLTFKSYENENVVLTTSSYHQIGYNNQDTDDTSTDYIKIDGRGSDSGTHITVNGTGTRGFVIANATYIWLTGISVDTTNMSTTSYGIYCRSINNDSASGVPNTDDDKGMKNSIIEYCTITGSTASDEAIKLTGWGTDSNEVRYCTIYFTADVAGINVSGGGYTDNPPTANLIHHNTIRNTTLTGINAPLSVNTEIYNNTIYECGDNDDDGVYESTSARGITSSGSTGLKIYNNRVYAIAQHGIILDYCTSPLVYNNVVYEFGQAAAAKGIYIAESSGTASGAKILNNTVVSSSAEENAIQVDAGPASTTIQNNIAIVSTSNTFCIRVGNTDVTIQNNNLYCDGAGYPFYDSQARALSYLNDTWGGTADSNISEDPNLDASYNLTDSSGNSIDGGLDLSAQGFSTDINGDSRGATWDIGADELGDSIAPTISSPTPSGTQVCTGPTQSVTLGVSTNENATCIYSPIDDDFLDMSNYHSGVTFTNTGGTSHSGVTTLASNASYIFYATCMDTSGVSNGASGTQIYFTINACSADPPGETITPGAGSIKTVPSNTAGSGVFKIQ